MLYLMSLNYESRLFKFAPPLGNAEEQESAKMKFITEQESEGWELMYQDEEEPTHFIFRRPTELA